MLDIREYLFPRSSVANRVNDSFNQAINEDILGTYKPCKYIIFIFKYNPLTRLMTKLINGKAKSF
jgi:hypothetical protein